MGKAKIAPNCDFFSMILFFARLDTFFCLTILDFQFNNIMDHLVRNAEIYRLISGARVDYGLDRELAFVLASAEMNGLMRPGAPYTEVKHC